MSVITGHHHINKSFWTTVIWEDLVFKVENCNEHYASTVMKNGCVIMHVLPWVCTFSNSNWHIFQAQLFFVSILYFLRKKPHSKNCQPYLYSGGVFGVVAAHIVEEAH